ncbi:hypothetical protein HNR25_001861 [Streptomonospora salina]|uniref:Uncharacterized protein n=1 Tax=Streptomonospora salina TaxID=104205 RepID=A0A841ECB9_9ACTN|nr:hypothetical protein [Streptomonospora salina]
MQGAVIHAPDNVRYQRREHPRVQQPMDAVICLAAT